MPSPKPVIAPGSNHAKSSQVAGSVTVWRNRPQVPYGASDAGRHGGGVGLARPPDGYGRPTGPPTPPHLRPWRPTAGRTNAVTTGNSANPRPSTGSIASD